MTKKEADLSGGLSGELLTDRASKQIKLLSTYLQNDKAIIGVGGIHDSGSAQSAIDAGAQLVQIYTSLIYDGPSVIKTIAKALKG